MPEDQQSGFQARCPRCRQQAEPSDGVVRHLSTCENNDWQPRIEPSLPSDGCEHADRFPCSFCADAEQQSELSVAAANFHRLWDEARAELERMTGDNKRHQDALWQLWHHDSLVETFLADRFPEINDAIVRARNAQ